MEKFWRILESNFWSHVSSWSSFKGIFQSMNSITFFSDNQNRFTSDCGCSEVTSSWQFRLMTNRNPDISKDGIHLLLEDFLVRINFTTYVFSDFQLAGNLFPFGVISCGHIFAENLIRILRSRSIVEIILLNYIFTHHIASYNIFLRELYDIKGLH